MAAIDRHRRGQHRDATLCCVPDVQIPVHRHDVGWYVVIARQTPVKDRVSLYKVPLDQRIHAEIAAPPRRRKLRALTAVGPDDLHGMEAQRGFRVLVQKRHLFAELHRIGPVVVALAYCEIFAAGSREGFGQVRMDANVFRPEYWSKKLWESGRVLSDNCRSSIGRCIVGNHDLDGEVDLLSNKAVESVPDVFLMVVGNRYDADFGLACGRNASYDGLSFPTAATTRAISSGAM